MAGDIVVEIKGLDEYLARLNTLDASLRGPLVTDALMQGAFIVEAYAKESILHGTPTGRVYRRRGIEHRASAPGQPPATDTGFLAGSIESKRGDQEAIVHVGAEYGIHLECIHLEYGTSRMAAHPFLRPAVDNHLDEINDAVKMALAKYLDEALA